MGEMHDMYGLYENGESPFDGEIDIIRSKPKREYIPENELNKKICTFVYPQGEMQITCFYWHDDSICYYPNRSNRYVVCRKLEDGTYKTYDRVAKYELKHLLK